MIQKAPVALLVMIHKCLVKSSLQPKRGTKRFTSEAQVRSLSCTLCPDCSVQRRICDPAQGRLLVFRVKEMLWRKPSRWGSQSQ
jgi:hypothetical protein